MHLTLPLRLAGALLMVAIALPGRAQEADLVGPVEGPVVLAGVSQPLPVLNQFGDLLYDNGPLINSIGTGPLGEDESILQNTTLFMGTNGFNVTWEAGFRIADDFVVPAPGWNVNEIVFYAYQTNSPMTSPIDEIYLRIFDGSPDDPGSVVVFGDTTTNRLGATDFTNILRRAETAPGSLARPIMSVSANVSAVLAPGTYWVDFTLSGDPALAGPWAPPITITGTTDTGNALQWVAANAAYQGMIDNGTMAVPGTYPQGLPFQVYGVPLTASEDGPAIAGEFALAAPVPNPSASGATVTVQVERAQELSVVVYDVVGRAVATLHEGPASVGSLRLAMNSSALPAGAYVVRASGEAGTVSQRLVITH